MIRHSRSIATALGLLCLCHLSYASGLTLDKRKVSPLTTKGDLYTFDTGNNRLPKGTDGTVLSSDSSTSTGLKWVTLPSGSGTVTNSGNLTSNAVVIGQGTTVIATITADSTAAHALMSTTGAPAFRQIVAADVLGAGGSPGGASSNIQYNSASSFAGATLITTDGARIAVGPDTSTLVSVDVAGSMRTVPFVLTDGSTIALDASKSNIFLVTLAGNRTLSNPTNTVVGSHFIVIVSQDGTGTRKMGFGTAYKFGTDVPSYDSSTTAGTKDYIGFFAGTTYSCDVVSVSRGYR